ncbi:MAG TPA: hypothetical protein VK489_00610 [Ferruginibacter sp.]|nr:hypothetical protein [Ferruginibacter sp.]
MQTCSRFLIICCILFFPPHVFAQEQDLTGLWKGYMYNDTTQLNYKYEIAISERKGKLKGFSHTYFIFENKEYHVVKKIKFKRDDDKLIVEDVEMIANNYPEARPKGVRQLTVLNFEMKGDVMILAGLFSTNRTKQYASATGYIHVERKSDFRQSALIPHLQELGLAEELSFVESVNIAGTKTEVKPTPVTEQPVAKTAPIKEQPVEEKPVVKAPPVTKPEVKTVPVSEKPVVKAPAVVKEKPVTEKPVVKAPPVEKPEVKAAPVAEKAKAPETVIAKPIEEKIPAAIALASAIDADKRTIETISALYFKTDSLVITLYDNGEVDGDTVSVLMNGKLIMPRVGLSTNAVRKTIYTRDIEDSIQIVMYAETLGSLPPNTGLLIVYDGTDRYEIRFSGDMKKSSAIMFRRKRPL